MSVSAAEDGVGAGASEKTVWRVTVTTDRLGTVCVMPESVMLGSGRLPDAEPAPSGQPGRSHGSAEQQPRKPLPRLE